VKRLGFAILGALLTAGVARAIEEPVEREPPRCTVHRIEHVDATRTRGEPFASGGDPEARPAVSRALLYRPAPSGMERIELPPTSRPTYGELLAFEAPAVAPADSLRGGLTFYGLQPPEAAIESSLAARSRCRLASPAETDKTSGAIAIVFAALPAPFYEGLAEALARSRIATLVVRGGEREVRPLLQAVLTRAGEAPSLALIGHGPGSATAALLAMSWNRVRARISIDGFEALARENHPGLTGDPDWRPGHERSRVLLLRPAGRPHADREYYERAERVDLVEVEVAGLEASPWATSPTLAPAPPALAPLLGPGPSPEAREWIVATAAAFISSATTAEPSREVRIPANLAESLNATHRPSLPRPAIVADGRLDEALWGGARRLDEAGPLALRVAEDCEWLYVALEPRRETPFTSELYFDVDGRGGERRGDDDLVLHASNSLCWRSGADDLAPSDCRKSEAWWEASRTVRKGDPPVAEYAVAKRRLGRSACESALGGSPPIRAMARVHGFGEASLLPDGADAARPDTWLLLDSTPAPGTR
jgi:hypothetical protein